MNAQAQSALEDIAKNAGAIVRCKACRNGWIAAADGKTEAAAYALAAGAWKGGEFRCASLSEVRDVMSTVLRDADAHCFSCGRGSD